MITIWNCDGPGAYTEFPLMNLININSKLSLIFNFFVDVGFSIFKFRLIDYDFPEIVLGEWDFEAPHVQPILGSMDGSTLTLHTGPLAEDREYFLSENYYESGDPADADGTENITLEGSGGTVHVIYGDWIQTFTGVTHIVADGGEGDDVLDASKLEDVTVDFIGGPGDNRLSTGTAGGTLTGGDGKDTLDGRKAIGPVTITGGMGDDSIFGGTGDDILTGNEGDDRITADDGNDTIDGGTGIDTLSGGDGDDTYIFTDDFASDRFDDREGVTTLDFTAMTDALEGDISQRGVNLVNPQG